MFFKRATPKVDPAADPNVIVDDVLFAKQEAIYASLVYARRRQWAARLGIRLCFLLASRALGYLSPWIASWPAGWNETGGLLLVIMQVLCVIFGFWTWTDRIFANLFHKAARQAYEARLLKRGYAQAGPEFTVDLLRLQMRHVPAPAQPT